MKNIWIGMAITVTLAGAGCGKKTPPTVPVRIQVGAPSQSRSLPHSLMDAFLDGPKILVANSCTFQSWELAITMDGPDLVGRAYHELEGSVNFDYTSGILNSATVTIPSFTIQVPTGPDRIFEVEGAFSDNCGTSGDKSYVVFGHSEPEGIFEDTDVYIPVMIHKRALNVTTAIGSLTVGNSGLVRVDVNWTNIPTGTCAPNFGSTNYINRVEVEDVDGEVMLTPMGGSVVGPAGQSGPPQFAVGGLPPGRTYRISVSCNGGTNWYDLYIPVNFSDPQNHTCDSASSAAPVDCT